MKKNNEFNNIIKDIINSQEFDRLKDISHHGISRYNHSMRVAYYTYLITKLLHLNYVKATRGALLHDFFTDEVKEFNSVFKLRRHPNCAVENAKKYFNISDIEEDIIKTHMFPITFTPPKYLESWVVDIIDDISAVYEKSFSLKTQVAAPLSLFIICLFNYIR